MLRPQKTFLHNHGTGDPQPSDALVAFAQKMGLLGHYESFDHLAGAIAAAGWSRALDGRLRHLRPYYQAKLSELREPLEQLGILAPAPGGMGLAYAEEGLWPAVAAQVCLDRLRVGIKAWNSGALRVQRIWALASSKPRALFPTELADLQTMGVDPISCVDELGLYENWMMRAMWEALKKAGDLPKEWLADGFFNVAATKEPIPGTPKTAPSTLATLYKWRTMSQATSAVIISRAPYALRAHDEASRFIGDCVFGLLADVPEDPLVMACITEVGKVVYNLSRQE